MSHTPSTGRTPTGEPRSTSRPRRSLSTGARTEEPVRVAAGGFCVVTNSGPGVTAVAAAAAAAAVRAAASEIARRRSSQRGRRDDRQHLPQRDVVGRGERPRGRARRSARRRQRGRDAAALEAHRRAAVAAERGGEKERRRGAAAARADAAARRAPRHARPVAGDAVERSPPALLPRAHHSSPTKVADEGCRESDCVYVNKMAMARAPAEERGLGRTGLQLRDWNFFINTLSSQAARLRVVVVARRGAGACSPRAANGAAGERCPGG